MRTINRTALTTARAAAWAALAVASAGALAGCGGGDSDAEAGAPTATVTVTETVTADPEPTEDATASETPSADATPTAQEPNTGDRALKVGQWREGINVRTRITEFFQPANAPKPSYLAGDTDGDGAIAKVEMCVRSGGEPAKGDIYDLFMGYDSSGGQYTQSSSTWGEWPPLPQLPSEVSIAPGKCLSGWVLLSAPKNTRFATVDMNDGEGGSIAEWKVS
jgi:hypothetical protein